MKKLMKTSSGRQITRFALLFFLLNKVIWPLPAYARDTLRPENLKDNAGLEEDLTRNLTGSSEPRVSRRTFVKAASLALGGAVVSGNFHEAAAFLNGPPQGVVPQTQKFMETAFKEEQAGQYLTYEGLQASKALADLKDLPPKERRRIVENLLHRRNFLNLRYDALTNARDRVSILLVDPSQYDPPATVNRPPSLQEILETIAKDPYFILSLLLFARAEVPRVGLDVPAPAAPAKTVREAPEQVLQLLDLDRSLLNERLARFREGPVTVEALFDTSREWKVMDRLKTEVGQLPEAQQERLLSELLWERVRIRFLLRDRGFEQPNAEILDRLLLARRIVYGTQLESEKSPVDDAILTHRAFVEALEKLRQGGLRTEREICETLVQLSRFPSRRAAAIQSFREIFQSDYRQATQGRMEGIQQRNALYSMASLVAGHLDFDLGVDALWKTEELEGKLLDHTTAQAYGRLLDLFARRTPQEQSRLIQRLLVDRKDLWLKDNLRRSDLFEILSNHPFPGSRDYLERMRPFLDFKDPVLFGRSLRWLVVFASHTEKEEAELREEVLNEVLRLLEENQGSHSYDAEEALTDIMPLAARPQTFRLQQKIVAFYEKFFRDEGINAGTRAVALAAWAAVLAGDPSEHPRILLQLMGFIQGGQKDREVAGAVLDRLLQGNDWQKVEPIVTAIVGQLPADFTLLHYRSFLLGNRSFRKGILWRDGIFLILQADALTKGIPMDRIGKIARLIRHYNQYIPKDSQVRRVILTGRETHISAGFDRNPPLVELGYGLVMSGSLDQAVRHEMMHAKYHSQSRHELLGWHSLFRLLQRVRESQLKSGQQWKVPPYELIDDSNFYVFDPSGVALENGDFRGHPDTNADEAFASAAGAFERNGDVLASYIHHALDPESHRVGLLIWAYLRDRIFHRVFTENGQDPFSQIPLGNPLALMPEPAPAGLEEKEAARVRLEETIRAIGDTMPLLNNPNRVVDLAVEMPELKLGDLIQEAGYTQGIARLVPTGLLPEAQQTATVTVLVWGSQRETVTGKLAGRVQFTEDVNEANLVIGDAGFDPELKSRYLASRRGPFLEVNKADVAERITVEFLMNLQTGGLLGPGTVLFLDRLVAGDFGVAILVFV